MAGNLGLARRKMIRPIGRGGRWDGGDGVLVFSRKDFFLLCMNSRSSKRNSVSRRQSQAVQQFLSPLLKLIEESKLKKNELVEGDVPKEQVSVTSVITLTGDVLGLYFNKGMMASLGCVCCLH